MVTLRKVDQKYVDILEMWCWTERVRNEELLHTAKGKDVSYVP